MSDIDVLTNETVLEVKQLETKATWLDSGQDTELKIIGYELKTKKCISSIEFRNESNGYYSGELLVINGKNKSKSKQVLNACLLSQRYKEFKANGTAENM